MSVNSQGSSTMWLSIQDATNIERKLVADFIRAILSSTKTAPNFIVRVAVDGIFILQNQINLPNSRSSRLLNERLTICNTFRIISVEPEKEVVFVMSNGMGRSERSIWITGFNPEVLPFAKKQEELSGNKNLTLDPQVFIALPQTIKDFSNSFSPTLTDHILRCMLKHLQVSSHSEIYSFSSNDATRDKPFIPVQFVDDKENTVHDLVTVLKVMKEKGDAEKRLASLIPADHSANYATN